MDEPPLPGEIFGKDSDSFVGIFVNACEMPKLTYNLRQHFSYMYCVLGCPQKFLFSIKTVDRKTLAAVVVVVGGGCYSTTVHCKILQVVTVCIDTRPQEGDSWTRYVFGWGRKGQHPLCQCQVVDFGR